jgi:hypothetical protein
MKNKELQELLKNFPDDMEVWVSDNGYSEGGLKLTKVEIVKAVNAGIDGDDVDDEYLYVDNDTDIAQYLTKGYFLSEDGETLSKEIIYLNDQV